jgi:hypothetical protein
MSTPYAAAGGKVYISNAAVYSEPADAAAYAALTWVEVGDPESVGEFGDEAQIITAATLQDTRVFKAKGPRDAGTLPLVVLHRPDDTGQQQLITAELTNLNWGFKIELPNKLTSGGSNQLIYFMGFVASQRLNPGNVSNIVRQTFNIAINSKLTIVAPT